MSTINQTPEESVHTVLSAREHAAIALRLPDSGTPWIDEMIAKARLLDTVTAIAAQLVNRRGPNDATEEAHTYADVLLDSVLFEPHLIGPLDPAPSAVPVAVWKGERLVEAPEPEFSFGDGQYQQCEGCHFDRQGKDACKEFCNSGVPAAIFGARCGARRVIYVKEKQ